MTIRLFLDAICGITFAVLFVAIYGFLGWAWYEALVDGGHIHRKSRASEPVENKGAE